MDLVHEVDRIHGCGFSPEDCASLSHSLTSLVSLAPTVAYNYVFAYMDF